MRAHLLTFVLGLVVNLSARGDIAEPPPIYVEGYASQSSYVPGDEAVFHISTGAPTFAATIERVGLERKKVWEKKGIPGRHNPVPDDASANGCHWPESFRVKIGNDWPTGYYQMTLQAQDNGGQWTRRGTRTAVGSLFFVVRPAKASAKILIQLCTNTYNAYTNYGGFSLYAFHGNSKNQGHRVSFERPQSSQYDRWELPFVQWAEKNGVVLDYACNSDLEFHPEILASYKLVLSVGHDEYWSAPMRDALEGYIAKGGNVAFLQAVGGFHRGKDENRGRQLFERGARNCE